MKVNKTAVVCMFIYIIITVLRVLKHIPWFDEAHAWTIAEQLNFIDMFNYVKNEGHFFIWQTLLYPFAHSHIIPYPYPMQILSWSFCTAALCLMWWKAPFNNWIKALITFSYPFLGCYGVIARCYSIGILLLFILAVMFNKKSKYPKTYALLLILCANTSAMAVIGATAFGLLFLHDIIFKNKLSKKDYILTMTILAIGALLIIYQVFFIDYFSSIEEKSDSFITIAMFENTYVYSNLLINSLLNVIFAIPILIYLFKDKVSAFFISFTFVILLILGFVLYGINFWHTYFFYVYLIIAFWLNKSDLNKIKIFASVILGLISFIFIFHYPEPVSARGVYKSDADKIEQYIESDEILKQSVILHNTGSIYEILPYLSEKPYKVRNYCTIEENTDYNLFNIFLGGCVRGNIFGQAQKHPEIIKALAAENTYAYTLADKNPQINNYGVIMADGYSILIKKYKCYEEHCFWKIEVI